MPPPPKAKYILHVHAYAIHIDLGLGTQFMCIYTHKLTNRYVLHNSALQTQVTTASVNQVKLNMDPLQYQFNLKYVCIYRTSPPPVQLKVLV